MKRFARVVGVLLVLLAAALAAVMIAWRQPDIPVEALKDKWAPAPSQFIDIAGMSMHVRDQGPRDAAETIVLLHGTSSSLHTWEGWAGALAERFRVVSFDLPGFGLTGPEPHNDYTIENYAKVVVAVLDKLGIAHCALGGNSLGGEIAWATAVLYPDRVDHLILVDAAGYPFTPKSMPIGFRIARTPVLRTLMQDVLPRKVVEASVKDVYGDPAKVTPELVDRYYAMTARAGNREALRYRFEQLKPKGLEKRIPEIRVPVLIEWGARDRLIPPDNVGNFHRDLPASQVVIYDDLGHVPQEEDAPRTVIAVEDFLAH